MGRFHLVNFYEKENTVEIVPDNWLSGEQCYWPPTISSSKFKRLVRAFSEPTSDWILVKARVLSSSRSYEKLQRRLKRSEETSNLSADSCVDSSQILFQPKIMSTPNSYQSSISNASSCNPLNTTSETFNRKLFRILEEIKQEIVEVKEEQAILRRIIQGGELKISSLPDDCPNMPIEGSEKLKEFNTYLEDQNKFNQVCSYFVGLGGASPPILVRKILSSIMTNNLSLIYNWRGTGGLKLAFQELRNVSKLITASVRSHHSFKHTTELEIEANIKKWLAYSKDRDGGRARRLKKN